MRGVATQTNIPIAGMKDGILIMRDGQYRVVLEIAAINFELKSEQEQNAIVFQYQSFLNSLHFPIEIVVQSKKLDLTPYLNRIKALSDKQTNELIKIQTVDYVDFVSQLINLANIMKKRFYVSVGFQPLTVSNGFLDKILKRNEPRAKLKISETDFDSYAKELRQRGQTVAQGLGGLGLHCRQLTTQEVVELFYEIYNPEVAGKERLTNTDDVAGSYVTMLKHDEQPNERATSESTPNENESNGLIDNKAVVAARQQEKSRQIAMQNSQETPSADKLGKEEISDDVLPGEKPPADDTGKAVPPEQQNTENYDY